ncbi:MAG: Mov34/MPN/PAD-1 family protein [Candidatus Heimdallarchaeota archaeon]|nr:Mov34/MPN/PAD-1 family protein [Candidatus Heimdallarchaeota archaeon]MBY8994568.1 Mov34/MPN/PAD-1 family protein [Candidatus Heimdallarchaeota archaeon]
MPKLEIEISPLAFSKVIDWTSSNTEREVGGYLIGKIDNEKVKIIETTYAVKNSSPTHVSIDEMAQFQIIKEIEKRDGKETIVGFWHTHPGLGCFMSGTDIATQKIYQALLPEAVAMVCDGNAFSKTREQKDFKAHFYRIDNNDKSQEINFGVLTNPNELLELLTDFVQDEENVENIVTNSVQKLSVHVKDSMELLAEEKLVSKSDFETADKSWKKGLANVRADVEEMQKLMVTKEEFNDLQEKQLTAYERQKRMNFVLLFTTILSLILVGVVLVLTLLP